MSAKFYPKPAQFESKHCVAPNSLIFNRELKDREKIFLLSLQAISTNTKTWVVCQTDLANRLGWGREKMEKCIKVCKKLGYLKVKQNRKNGQFSTNEFEFDLEGSYSKNNDNSSVEKCPHNEYEPRGCFPGPVVPGPESQALPSSLPRSLTNLKKDLGQKMTAVVHKNEEKTLDVRKRWVLNDDQFESYNFLKSCSIDAEDKKLCYWAKTYPLQRLVDVFNEAKNNKAKSYRKYMSKLLDQGKVVFNARIEANSSFAKDYMKIHNWNTPKVFKNYMKIPIGVDFIEIDFDMDSEQFMRRLLEKHENSQR